jgi:hypothetical protein
MERMRALAFAFLCASRAFAAPASATLAGEGRQPQVAVSADGAVAVVYGTPATEDAPGRVLCRVSGDGGKTFAPEREIARVAGLALGMRRGPRVAWSGRTLVVLAISHATGNLSAWRSADRGATWNAPVRVNDAEKSAIEGMHDLGVSGGTLLAAWLDGRTKGTKIYAARSTDGGATWSPNARVYASPDGHTCECCSPSVGPDGRGGFAIMWRNWLKGSRDMWLASSADAGRTFGKARKLGTGTWPLDGCPMAGGGLAPEPGGKLLTLWRREGELFECRPGEPEHDLGAGDQPWAAAGPGGVYRVWKAGEAITLLAPGAPAAELGHGAWPVLAAAPSGSPLVAAWQLAGDRGGIVTALLR